MNDFSFDDFNAEDDESFVADMKTLVEKAEEAYGIKKAIEEIELELKQFNERLNFLTRTQIPAIARELGVKSIDLTDGTKVKITEGVTASQLDEGKEYFAFAKQYLIDHEAADLLKTIVSTEFGRGSHNESIALVEELREKGYDAKAKETVHASTYKSFGNELFDDYQRALEKGKATEEPPFKELGMFVVREAKITPKKEKK